MLEAKGKELVGMAREMGRASIFGDVILRIVLADRLHAQGINFLVKAREHMKEAAVYKRTWGVQTGTSKAKAAAKSAMGLCNFTAELCKKVSDAEKRDSLVTELKEIWQRAFFVWHICQPFKTLSPLNEW